MSAGDRNHLVELQYDGTGLHGWAKQQGLSTVEGCIEEALRSVLNRTPPLRVAGRTDAGVHAFRQVASVRLPAGIDLARLARSVNALTPPGIAVTNIAPASPDFDARRDALSRTYRYFVSAAGVSSPFWVPYAWHVPGRVDLAAMSECASLVTGNHDFTAFTPHETAHVLFRRNVVRCAWEEMDRVPSSVGPGGSGRVIYFEIEADAFLRHMVRTLVGTMVEVGKGKRSCEGFGHLLTGALREQAGPTAPAHGLFLWDVRYRNGLSQP